MRNAYVQASRSVGPLAAFERLCRWWTQASNEERFLCLKASIEGDENAPPIQTLRLASLAAEISNGEVSG